MARHFASSGTFLPALVFVFLVGLLQLGQGCARPAACERNSDCNNAYCHEGECKRDCIDAERDCPEGWVCNLNAQCVPLYEGAGGQGGGDADAGDSDAGEGGAGASGDMDAGDAGDAADDASIDPGLDAGEDASDDASIEDDAGDSGGMGGAGGRGGSGGSDGEDGGRGGSGGSDGEDGGLGGSGGSGGSEDDGGVEPPRPLSLLDLCSADEDCEGSFICRPMYVDGPKRCTKSCTASAQCMTGTRCETVGGERYCAQSDIGKSCWSNGECNATCLANQNYCTSQCQSGADCPNGFGCTHVGGAKMCVKVAIYCDERDPGAGICAPNAAACDVGYNLLAQSCTTRCQTDADCPQRASGLAPWRCNPSDKYCDRPDDIFGPIPGGERTEYACQSYNGPVRNLCNDGLQTNIDAWKPISRPGVDCWADNTTTGFPGDSCIDSCRYQGGCAFGFHCAALTAISGPSRIGVCLPTGAGEIGVHCTKHRDCVFGYCNLSTNTCTRDCSADSICPGDSTCVATGDYVEGIAFRRCE